jgi:hypothetical protein
LILTGATIFCSSVNAIAISWFIRVFFKKGKGIDE